jgi:serine/threonine protein kinase
MAKKKSTKPIKDFYGALEVSSRASPEVIDAAYKTLIKQYHPDRGGDEGIAKLLNEARDVLTDSRKRARYDGAIGADRENLENVVGNYRILKELAEGGFGKTYLGEHVTLKTPICLKHAYKISPQDEEILVEEARSIWDLRHFGIPAVRDLFKTDKGVMSLVMSYIPGPTLEQLVKKTGGLDPEDTIWIAERCLNVLKYLHYNGVVHGDVKPQNIIIQPESHNIVMVDYGLAAVKPKDERSNKGYTPLFASPEQERGDVIIPESDFYSLGKSLVYILGGDVSNNLVPDSVPKPMCKFMKRLVVRDPLSRPNWGKEDLCDTVQDLRTKIFGRRHSGMKKIKGI